MLKSQSLIKSIDGRDRKEAIEILNYDEKIIISMNTLDIESKLAKLQPLYTTVITNKREFKAQRWRINF